LICDTLQPWLLAGGERVRKLSLILNLHITLQQLTLQLTLQHQLLTNLQQFALLLISLPWLLLVHPGKRDGK